MDKKKPSPPPPPPFPPPMRATVAVARPSRPSAPVLSRRPGAPSPRGRAPPPFAVSRPSPPAAPVVTIDNDESDTTIVRVTGASRPGLLTALTAAFRDLGLDVRKVRRKGG